MIYGIAENPRPTGKCVKYAAASWGLLYVPSRSDLPLGNPQNSVSFWQKWHIQIGLSEE